MDKVSEDVSMDEHWLDGSWTQAGDGSIRARVVPMISDALKRTPMMGLPLIGWDCVMVPMANAMILGVAIAVRGVDLTGPRKELMQFRPFSGWNPDQAEVDQIVGAIIAGLRDARAEQSSTVGHGQMM